MKAVMLIPQSGGAKPELQEIPEPSIRDNEVLVRVHATAINRGEIPGLKMFVTGKPRISGIELAGEIVALGGAVSGFQVGDRVMAQTRQSHAEYVAVNEQLLIRIPDAMSWSEAAAIPNVMVTTHDAIVTNGQLKPGETVLVNAASSGIGVMAIQVAKALGAGQIIASSRSAAKLDALAAIGADHLVDLSTQKILDVVDRCTDKKGVDLIIDSVGAEAFQDNMSVLAVQGRLIGVGRLGGEKAQIDLDLLALKRIRLIGVTFRTRNLEETIQCTQSCIKDLIKPLESGQIRGIVDSSFPLADVSAAHEYMLAETHTGKIILTL